MLDVECRMGFAEQCVLDVECGLGFAEQCVLDVQAPQPPEPWKGVLWATELPPACPQPRMGMTYIDMHIPGFNRTSEDCLYLNIHSPKVSV